MFYVTKIVWLLAQPLSLAFFLSVFGALLGLLGWRRMGSNMALAAALVLFLTLYTTTGNWLCRRWKTGCRDLRRSRARLPA